MRILLILSILWISGCQAPRVNLDAGKLKGDQKQRVKEANQGVKDQTGVDLGTSKPEKRKLGLPTAPIEP